MIGPGGLKTIGGRERYQAVAQRLERVHFELLHIAPFDPAVPCRALAFANRTEAEKSPGRRVPLDDAGTMHRRSDGANLPNSRPRFWAARDQKSAVLAGPPSTCPFAGTALYGTPSLHKDARRLLSASGATHATVTRTLRLPIALNAP